MRILLTGGTGFIGRALCQRLLADHHDLIVFSRHPERVPQLCGAGVHGVGDWAQLDGVAVDAVINLAGEGIADRRWTAARKRRLRASRIDVTRALVDWMARNTQPPTRLISGSAIGWYGDQGARELDEAAAPLPDFAHELCRDWEAEAQRASALGARVCILRTGVVLDPSGGMLKKLLPAFRLGLGGRLGDGSQWLSWITRDDLIELIVFLLHHPELVGVFSATAPNPVTNRTFTEALAAAVRRPALLTTPACALRLVFGEMAQLLLGGQKVLPRRIVAAGFAFRHPQLNAALAAVLPR
jgi:uncharacterized protein (TIGR01777 family)